MIHRTALVQTFAAAATQDFTDSGHYLDTEEAAALLAGGCGCGNGPEPLSAFAVDAEAPPSTTRWEGPLVFENQLTGDGRMIEPNALRWEDLPLPFRVVNSDVGAHDGAQVVGRILTIERRRGGVIWGEGDFDLGSEVGVEAARYVREQLRNGVSVDLDSVSFEIRVAKELLDSMYEDAEEGAETDEEGRVTVIEIDANDEIMVTTDARIRAATLVDIPAFAGARIELVEADEIEDEEEEEVEEEEEGAPLATVLPLVAGAAPVAPPASWFQNPNLREPTPFTVTEDGRAYGHLATWGTCHIGYSGQCVTPPHSASDYAYFRTGSVITAEGQEIPVGRVTLNTLHARGDLNATRAMAHYENTGLALVDITVGEDSVGIWAAGALRPTATEEQIRMLRSSPISGDWRRIGGSMELVAALAVNVPGFPIPRPSGLVASGNMQTLVAAGMLPPQRVLPPGLPGAFSPEDLRYLKGLIARERGSEQAARKTKAEALAARVRRARVEAMAAALR